MLLGRVAIITITVLTAHSSAQSGEIKQQNGRQIWVSEACEPPLAPAVNRDDAQGLNQSIIGFNRFVGLVDAYNQCLSQEAARDVEAFVGVVNNSVRDLQDEAIAGVEVERAALARDKP
ncbi:MAG: hypothetical protein ACTSX7_13990 [Alphaproteobacteria bacterium]